MSINAGLMSSESTEWETPQWLFDELNETFQFTLDPCASAENNKCDKWFSKKENGLEQSWKGERVFMNPPYGREIVLWVRKAWRENVDHGTLVMALLPARTDTAWWHAYVKDKATLRFLRGRLKFGDSKNSAPFPSVLALYW